MIQNEIKIVCELHELVLILLFTDLIAKYFIQISTVIWMLGLEPYTIIIQKDDSRR